MNVLRIKKAFGCSNMDDEVVYSYMIPRKDEYITIDKITYKVVSVTYDVVKISVPSTIDISMLHFELYDNQDDKTSLSVVPKPPYNRRADLLNPTEYLDIAEIKA